MNKELWLMRHGKSDRESLLEDFARPLKKRGKQAARRMAEWMKKQELIPDLVISSPALRALETANRVCAVIGIAKHSIIQDKRVYEQGCQGLKSVLADCPEKAGKILLVGHNPDLEDLLIHLAGAANMPVVDKLLPTAALARLTMPENWAELERGCAGLIAITYPKSITKDVS